MSWHFLPDVTGPGTFNLGDLANDNGFQPPLDYRALVAAATGSGTARLGDQLTVSASWGSPIPATAGSAQRLTLPYVGRGCLNSLSQLSVFVPAGCTVSVAFEY